MVGDEQPAPANARQKSPPPPHRALPRREVAGAPPVVTRGGRVDAATVMDGDTTAIDSIRRVVVRLLSVRRAAHRADRTWPRSSGGDREAPGWGPRAAPAFAGPPRPAVAEGLPR